MEVPRQVTVNITPGIVFKTILLLILLYILYLVRDIVLVVLTSVVIASAIEPATRWLGRYHIKRVFAVIIIYIVIALFFLGFVYFFVPPFVSDVLDFLDDIPKLLEKLSLWNPLTSSADSDSQRLVKDLAGRFSPKEALGQFSSVITNISGAFLRIISSVFGGLLSFIFIVVLSFYLSVQEDGVAQFLRVITPLRHEKYVIDLWRRSQRKIGLWMQGQVMLSVVVGVLVFLGLTLLGVVVPGIRNALLFALLALIFEIIPVFGPILAAIPPVILAFGEGGVTSGLLVIGLYLVIQQFENHLIYPLVVRKIVGIPPTLVILALLIGGKLAGFLGILLSVPIAAVIMEYLDDVSRFKAQGRISDV